MVRGARLKPRTLVSRLSSVTVLRVILVLLVLWCEYGAFSWSVATCRWPELSAKRQNAGDGEPWAHILLVADPQVLDQYAYPGRSKFLSILTQLFVDFNLRKSWRVTKAFKPDVIVFLGDMTDRGRFIMSTEEYEAYIGRFKHIFRTNSYTPTYYLPGNHDVGLGNAQQFSNDAKQRFQQSYGPLNQAIDVNGFRIVFIDAPDLVDEDYKRHTAGKTFDQWRGSRGGAIDFVQRLSEDKSANPVILLSHIPLARPESANCGPLREKGNIHRGVGFGYQNVLGKETTDFLMSYLRPSIIFSGDDHDYCDYTHHVPSRHLAPVREVTVKSFSMAMGIKRPGFQLLSLPSLTTTASSTLLDRPCLLPNQYKILTRVYPPFILLAILYLSYVRLWARNTTRRTPPTLSLRRPSDNSTRPPLVSGASDSDRSPDYHDMSFDDLDMPPPLSSRSMMTATLTSHFPGRSSPLESPYLHPTTHSESRDIDPESIEFDGRDSTAFLPKPATHGRQKSRSRSFFWVDAWKKRERLRPPQKWQLPSIPTVLFQFMRRKRKIRRGKFASLWIDIVQTAWPPALTYLLVVILTFH